MVALRATGGVPRDLPDRARVQALLGRVQQGLPHDGGVVGRVQLDGHGERGQRSQL